MIRVLCQGGEEWTGTAIAEDLRQAFDLGATPEVLSDDAMWASSPEWNDVLLVVYRSTDVPETIRAYIQSYREAHALADPGTRQPRPGGVVLPVALDPGSPRPPGPISGIVGPRVSGRARSTPPPSRLSAVRSGR